MPHPVGRPPKDEVDKSRFVLIQVWPRTKALLRSLTAKRRSSNGQPVSMARTLDDLLVEEVRRAHP